MVSATVIITVLTQIEALEGVLRPVMYAAWAGTSASALILSKFRVKPSGFTLWFALAYVIWLLLCGVLSLMGFEHLNGRYLGAMIIPLLMTVTADMTRKLFDHDELIRLCKVYALAAAAYALYVQINYFASYTSWLSSHVYAFQDKNSAAQIWCSAVLCIVYMIRPRGLREKLLWYGLAAFMLLVVGFSQCRTALLALAIVLAAHVMLYSKHKLRWLIGVGVTAALLLAIPFTRRFISQMLLLEKYAGADLNTLSSGRIGKYIRALEYFVQSPFIGTGRYYVDCSYLMVLTEGGILGFLLIESIWGCRAAINLKSWRTQWRLPAMLTVFYFGESLLEGFPPFGPGVSAFFFWLMSGYLHTEKQKRQRITGARRLRRTH